ncbi:MAG: helix-turn-helix domain-containing protein [Nitrospirae bacterium]|nr:helix-turn-helix domain-containing protein [Nitrospirota bacterium]
MENEGVLCTDCRKYAGCKEVCVFIEQELLELDSRDYYIPEINDNAIVIDYKTILNEIAQGQQWKRRVTIENIRTITDIRLRAVAAMLYGGLSAKQISKMLNISLSTLYRIIRNNDQPCICCMFAELELPGIISGK